MKVLILGHSFTRSLLKFYLDILARNVLPALLSGFKNDCRKHAVCTPSTCFGLRKIKIKEIVFVNALKFSKKLAEHSCMCVNSCYIVDAFNNYKQGVAFRN